MTRKAGGVEMLGDKNNRYTYDHVSERTLQKLRDYFEREARESPSHQIERRFSDIAAATNLSILSVQRGVNQLEEMRELVTIRSKYRGQPSKYLWLGKPINQETITLPASQVQVLYQRIIELEEQKEELLQREQELQAQLKALREGIGISVTKEG